MKLKNSRLSTDSRKLPTLALKSSNTRNSMSTYRKRSFVFLSEPVSYLLVLTFFKGNAYHMPWRQKILACSPGLCTAVRLSSPIEIQLCIMFWAACGETNDRRKKVNEQLLRIPVCLYTSFPLSVNFNPSTGYQPRMKTIQRFESRRNQRCHHCFRRNTQQVSISASIYFP